MTRIVVLGTSGSGKTTVSRTLAERLGANLFELDELSLGPGWQKIPTADFRSRVLEAVAAHDWVVDGNYERALGDLVLARADTAVWLDLPLRVSLARMLTRTRSLIRDDTVLWHGNRERWRPAHLNWAIWEIRSHIRRRFRMKSRLSRHRQLEIVHLRSQADIDAWLARWLIPNDSASPPQTT